MYSTVPFKLRSYKFYKIEIRRQELETLPIIEQEQMVSEINARLLQFLHV